MLKKIEVSQLRLGMHLHGFDGPWIDHPFWRTRFVLHDPADLHGRRLQLHALGSGVRFDGLAGSAVRHGSLVRMQSGRIGVVVEQNAAQMAAPVVKLFISTKSDRPITPVRLDLAEAGVGDRIDGRESPDRWGFKHIDDLWLEPGWRSAAK